MSILKPFSKVCLLLLVFTIRVFSQQYLDERNMKITKVSQDDTYGYTKTNPVKIGSNKNANGAYLNALIVSDGDKMHIKYMKTNYDSINGLYRIVLNYEKKQDSTVLYLLSTEYEAPQAPKGFKFKTKNDLPKVAIFPLDSIKKAKSCKPDIYTTKNDILTEKFGNSIQNPDKAPEYNGGIDSLKKYFSEHPLTDENAKKYTIDVAICFFVTCSGQAGNFEIIGKPYGDLETYSNQVLAIVNNMPANWLPAIKSGKPVDCYQSLVFTIVNGSLENLVY